MVYKGCPVCQISVPVATKYCSCGHVFFNKRLYHPKLPVKGDHSLSRRRTERVSRGRPAYYSASEFENPFRRYSTSNRSTMDKTAKATTSRSKSVDPKVSPSRRRRRKKAGRPKVLRKKKESKEKADKTEKVETDEFEMYINGSTEKQFTFAVTLAEINRKLGKEWNGPRRKLTKETTDSTASR